MEIKRDFTLTFNEEEYVRMHGERFAALLRQPSRQAAFAEALAEVKRVSEPVVAWDRFPIQKMQHEKIVLANGVKIGGGPVVPVTGGAEELVVAVCTIGREADERIRFYQQNKEMFKGLLLDELASWAVDMVRQEFCRWVEEEAKRDGRRTSTPLSPGESAWSVEDQRVIFSLLAADLIGVTLTDTMIMYPLKSLSLILGTGRQPMGVEGASNCDFCSMKERCNYRHLRVKH